MLLCKEISEETDRGEYICYVSTGKASHLDIKYFQIFSAFYIIMKEVGGRGLVLSHDSPPWVRNCWLQIGSRKVTSSAKSRLAILEFLQSKG